MSEHIDATLGDDGILRLHIDGSKQVDSIRQELMRDADSDTERDYVNFVEIELTEWHQEESRQSAGDD